MTNDNSPRLDDESCGRVADIVCSLPLRAEWANAAPDSRQRWSKADVTSRVRAIVKDLVASAEMHSDAPTVRDERERLDRIEVLARKLLTTLSGPDHRGLTQQVAALTSFYEQSNAGRFERVSSKRILTEPLKVLVETAANSREELRQFDGPGRARLHERMYGTPERYLVRECSSVLAEWHGGVPKTAVIREMAEQVWKLAFGYDPDPVALDHALDEGSADVRAKRYRRPRYAPATFRSILGKIAD